jgi:hypothetical protein
VVTIPCVSKEDVTVLHIELQKGEKKETTLPGCEGRRILSKVPDLCVFIMSHISLTPYSFEFHKGSDVS